MMKPFMAETMRICDAEPGVLDGSRTSALRLPPEVKAAVLRRHLAPSRFLLVVSVARQRMSLFELDNQENRRRAAGRFPAYVFRERYRVSTSRFGTGQVEHSNQTPLGLHRVARKVGGGYPAGTVFTSRQPVGLTWQGKAGAPIVHRILWLEGLEPGRNRGGNVDTFRRYVYIHGYGDETTLGKPRSSGCVHVAAADLMPLYDRLPLGTLVWISAR